MLSVGGLEVVVMGDLDKRLKNLQTICEFCDKAPVLSDTCIERIKSVFADEGWVDLATTPPLIQLAHGTYMSGQEWYSRFEKEFKGFTGEDGPVMNEYILEAAKKASGL